MTHVVACQADIVLVIDCSASIGIQQSGVTWNLVIDFLVRLVSAVSVGENETHVAAVTFGTQIKRRYHVVVITHSHDSARVL